MERLGSDQLSDIQAHACAPADYTQWLVANGWGGVGEDRFMLFSGLTPVRTLHAAAPAGYWAFGDNFSGFIACFSEDADGLVYEWDSATCQMTCTGSRFPSYIHRYTALING
jgi:hypothetical protein